MNSLAKWHFTAESAFFSCQENVFEEKRLNHLARFVKRAHDRNFLKENPKPCYIKDRVNYKGWRLRREEAKLRVSIQPINYASAQ